MRVKNVIFDLDGLLFDSERTVFEIYSNIAKEKGKKLAFEVFISSAYFKCIHTYIIYRDRYARYSAKNY